MTHEVLALVDMLIAAAGRLLEAADVLLDAMEGRWWPTQVL